MLGASLGWRYAFARGSSLSFIGNVAICGLALSIAVLVVVVSVINGFERELERRVFAVLPHLSLNGWEPVPASMAGHREARIAARGRTRPFPSFRRSGSQPARTTSRACF